MIVRRTGGLRGTKQVIHPLTACDDRLIVKSPVCQVGNTHIFVCITVFPCAFVVSISRGAGSRKIYEFSGIRPVLILGAI